MLCRSALSTQDEFAQLLATETPAISERVHEAWCEYQLAKLDWDNFVYALGAFPSGGRPADGALIVSELAQRERNTLCKMAAALQELYDRNQPEEKFVA
jgi:hypothetical protein